MALTNALPEPRKPYVVSESRDPLVVVRSLAYQFGALSVELKAAVGIRDQLYHGILKDAYWIGTFFKECPDQYHRFKNDEYWRDVRRKPNDSNIMRSVLSRASCAQRCRNRYRIAHVNTPECWSPSISKIFSPMTFRNA